MEKPETGERPAEVVTFCAEQAATARRRGRKGGTERLKEAKTAWKGR